MKIFLIGWFGAGNMGDEAILLSEILSIREKFSKARFYILSFCTKRTRKLTAGIPEIEKIIGMGTRFSFLRSDFRGLLNAFRNTDIVVIGGGGIFQDIYNHYPIPFFTFMALMAKVFRKKLVFHSVGIGPVNTVIGRTLCRVAADSADIISVRDQESMDLLMKFGVRKKIHASADPVFLLRPEMTERAGKIEAENIFSAGPVIGVCVQDLLFWNDGNKRAFAEALDELHIKMKSRTVLLPMGAYHDGWFRKEKSDTVDAAASKKLAGMMKSGHFMLADDLGPREIMHIIGKFDLMISMRLHGLIMGISSGVPVIALTYKKEMKIENLMKRIGQRERLFFADDLDKDGLLRCMEDILSREDEFKKDIREKASVLSKDALKSIELLQDTK